MSTTAPVRKPLSTVLRVLSLVLLAVNSHSATSPYTSTPPMIVKGKKIIGYLSANKNLRASISPNLLKALCKDDF
jgi:hypothetical protein